MPVDCPFDELCGRIKACKRPEDLIALVPGCRDVHEAWATLQEDVDPDVHEDDEEEFALADEAYSHLEHLYHQMDERDPIDDASDASVRPFTIEGKSARYEVDAAIATGDLATVYRAKVLEGASPGERVAVKVPHDPKNNGLMAHERGILRTLDHRAFPKVLDMADVKGADATVMEYFRGYDLFGVREIPRYRQGLQGKDRFHAGWFLEYGFAGLGHMHEKVIVHGTLEPGNIMVIPGLHRVVFLDFCYAVKKPRPTDYIGIPEPPRPYSAPEVAQRGTPDPAMDMFAFAMSAIYLLGGDVETKTVSGRLDGRFRRLLDELTDDDSSNRPRDAYQMAYRVMSTRFKIWPDHGFIPMPVK